MGGALLRDLSSDGTIVLELIDGLPVGAARCSRDDAEHPSTPLAGVLRLAGSPQIAARYPVVVGARKVDDLCEALASAWARHHPLDPFWITAVGDSDGDDVVLTLLTREQLQVTRPHLLEFAVDAEIVLSNGQIVTPIVPSDPLWLARRSTMECRSIMFTDTTDGLTADGTSYFQAIPSGEHARRLSASHSFRCLVAPSLRGRFTSGFAAVRNPVLERAYPGTDLSLAVLVRFTARVPPEKVVVDETVATAIGLRPGEIVEVLPLPKLVPPLAQRAFAFRHSLCRVHGSNTTDMEKPLVRLPEEVFDIIGIAAGARIVLESFSCHPGTDPSRKTIVVRALPWRGEEWPAPKLGVADILMETGSRDLPPVTLDLACQQQLGTSRGSVVYVRPAVGSLLLDEWSNAATAVVIAALGAAVLGQGLLSVAFLLAFVALLILQVWRRLR